MGDFDVAVTATAGLIFAAMTYGFILVLRGAVEGTGTLKAVPLLKRRPPAPPPDAGQPAGDEPASEPVTAPLTLPGAAA
jgi:hypothetical protein